MSNQKREPFGCLAWAVIVGVILLLLSLLAPLTNRVSKVGEVMMSVSNCRQVIVSLKQYATLHDDAFPDTVITQNGGVCRSSNAAFRQMIKEEIVTDERIFGCPKSPFTPDNNIGTAPEFTEALKPGECHWMMTAELNDRMAGHIPFVFENTIYPDPPLRWRTDDDAKLSRGRSWKGKKIIIGRLDGSAAVFDLKPDGTAITNGAPNHSNQTPIDLPQPFKILYIEE